MRRIDSTRNPLVKRLYALRQKSLRQEQQCFVVEGRRAIDGFMDHGWQPQQLLLGAEQDLPARWTAAETYEVSQAVLEKLSSHRQQPGYLAVFAMPEPAPLDKALGGLVLYHVADPGNVGTLIRSAAAFGWQQVVLLATADPWSPKVVQASVGALAGIRLHSLSSDSDLEQLGDELPRAALVLAGGSDPRQMPQQPRWLIVGSEAHGITPDVIATCSERVSIPMQAATESLNAAVAGSIAACCLGIC